MPSLETGCHELKVKDENHEWRIVYAVEPDAIVILEVFGKGSRRTPTSSRRVDVVCESTDGS
jgi:phage-related protein